MSTGAHSAPEPKAWRPTPTRPSVPPAVVLEDWEEDQYLWVTVERVQASAGAFLVP